MKFSFSRFYIFPAVAAGVLLGGVLFAGFNHSAQGKGATPVAAPANTASTPSYLRVAVSDGFTQELRLDSDTPVSVATKLQDIDYVVTADPHRQNDGSVLVAIGIKKTVHTTIAGQSSTSDQAVHTSQFLTLDGRASNIAGFRTTVSTKPVGIVSKTTISLHSQSMFQP